jgi:O-antigen/teichoic acid export membrane protein
MAIAARTALSTVSLVIARSLGVGARALGLLTLAAGMPAERFAHYAVALVLSELARCATDFGLDPVLLRRGEGLDECDQRPMLRAALAVRGLHGTVASVAVLLILLAFFPMDVLLVAAGLQFLSQGMLQLGLNWRQINNAAHLTAPWLILFYGIVIAIAIAAYFQPALGIIPLPALLGGELLAAAWLLAPLGRPGRADWRQGYERLVPQALPMAGIMLLAFINTRTDALLVGRLIAPRDAGHYLYLARWADLAPMLATGVALPLVGKLRGFNPWRSAPLFLAVGAALIAMPFALVQTAGWINPAYAGDPILRILLATTAACRIGLAATTVTLLARWHDGALARLAAVTTMVLPVLTWWLGSAHGAHGVASGVLIAELGNLLFQTALLLGRPFSLRPLRKSP